MSTTVVNSTIRFAIQQTAIYFGVPILVIGVFGGLLNVTIFLSLQTFRQSSCVFFLLIMSLVNIGQLLASLLTRILITGFRIDWTESSIGFCKFRNYFLQVCALISYTCMCLATIDQFLATSLRARWQNLFTIRKAHLLCVLFAIIWVMHGVPTLIWYNLSPSASTGRNSCTITNTVFQQYHIYGYLIILTGILPICITILFGTLAYWQVRQIPYRTVPLVRRELDKQLSSMVLVQVVFNLFVIIPYIVVLVMLNSPDISRRVVNTSSFTFASTFLGLMYYLYFAVRPTNGAVGIKFDVSFFSESILHLYDRFETISSTINSYFRQHFPQTIQTASHLKQSNIARR